MKFLILIYLSLLESLSFAVVPAHLSLTENFEQKANFELQAKIRPVSIIYGNRDYGFFKTKSFTKSGNNIQVSLVAPGFKKSVGFWAVLKKSKTPIKIGEYQFESPLPAAYQSIKTYVGGRFTSNYFVLSGSLPVSRFSLADRVASGPDYPMKNESRFSFLMIVNRLGEIVWVYVPRRDGGHFDSYVFGKPVRKGVYGIILGKKDGYFSLVDYKGNELYTLDSSRGKNHFPLHHDFVMLGKRSFLTIGNSFMRMEGIGSLFNSDTFLTNTIIRVNLANDRAKVVMDPSRIYNPATVSHWQENKEKKRFVSWNDETADHDFLHINALERTEEGRFLISFKHVDKVLLASKNMKKILWTVGPAKEDTFRVTSESRFSHQHTPSLLENGNLIVFDNGFSRKESRILELKLDKKSRVAEVAWQFHPKPSLFSENRSSVKVLENNNIVSYFVSPDINGREQAGDVRSDFMIEVDREKSNEIARMKLDFLTISPGYRAIPIETIGDEELAQNVNVP